MKGENYWFPKWHIKMLSHLCSEIWVLYCLLSSKASSLKSVEVFTSHFKLCEENKTMENFLQRGGNIANHFHNLGKNIRVGCFQQWLERNWVSLKVFRSAFSQSPWQVQNEIWKKNKSLIKENILNSKCSGSVNHLHINTWICG